MAAIVMRNICSLWMYVSVYEELKEEDYDKVKQAYKEYREAGNPPILGEDGDEIVYE